MVNCQNKENGFLYTFHAGENRKATDTVLSDFLRGMRESSYHATNCDIVTTETTVFVPWLRSDFYLFPVICLSGRPAAGSWRVTLFVLADRVWKHSKYRNYIIELWEFVLNCTYCRRAEKWRQYMRKFDSELFGQIKLQRLSHYRRGCCDSGTKTLHMKSASLFKLYSVRL